MIKKLFCKHEYDCYHADSYVPFLAVSSFTRWHYICSKCNKTSMLYELDIIDTWNSIRETVAKEKAMGVDNSLYDDYVYVLGDKLYRGKGAFYMSEVYKKYNQKQTRHR